jgi:malonyl-CoA O-methyltransferase
VDADALRRRRTRRRFDRAARGYEQSAKLEAEIAARMLERLDYVRLAPSRILDAGAGSGRDARALAKHYRGAQVVALDASIGMLRAMRSATGFVTRLLSRAPEGVCGDLSQLPFPGAAFDLAWSNLALHWVRDPLDAFRECARVLRTGGLFMFSAYGPDTFRELRALQPAGFPAFVDMHDLGDMLGACGLAAPVMDMERLTLTYADARAFFADLQATAQTTAAGPGLGGRQRILALGQALDAQRVDGRLPVSYEIVYGHAWKVPARRTAEGHAIVRADFAKRSVRP